MPHGPRIRIGQRLQPSPVITLNRAVAVAKVKGPAAALAMIEPLGPCTATSQKKFADLSERRSLVRP
jgi:predicted RNA polymerase sigma factor